MSIEILMWILAIVFAVFLAYNIFVYAKTGVPIVCLSKKCVKTLMQELEVDDESVVYELGSGLGEFTFAVAALKPKRVVGYELSALHVVFCKLKAWAASSQAKFCRRDFFEADLSDADIIYFWLVPKVAERAWKKVKSECKPGTLVIQYGTKLRDMEPINSLPADEGVINSPKFHYYRV